MDRITVGIRYEPLGGVTNVVTGAHENKEADIHMKHWVLVFLGSEFGFRVEAGPGPEGRQEILFRMTPCPSNYGQHTIGTYRGDWFDFKEILLVHPQRSTTYSPTFNNCQHFVAGYLVLLQALANGSYSKSFDIGYKSRYDKLQAVLNKDQKQLWHEPNLLMGTLNFAPVPTAGAIAGTALVAAEATVSTTVAAGGIAGWFGLTTTVVVPAAYATFAAFCAPIALAGTGAAGAAYLMRRAEWKRNTHFDNPLVSGFPKGYFPALSFPERSAPLSAKEGFFNTHSALTASVISTSVVGVAGFVHNPAAVGAQRAADLFKLAGKFIG